MSVKFYPLPFSVTLWCADIALQSVKPPKKKKKKKKKRPRRPKDQVQAHNNSEEIERLLITKEAYWSAQLFSLAPYGLNKRREFHSKNRICYN